jgi:hypothetical protein
MITLLFVLIISLLLIHEMDAIRTKEWKMFIILKDLPDETAYKAFTIAHLPLYFSAILTLVQVNLTAIYYIIDLFLIAHTVIHFCFRKKKRIMGLLQYFQI